MNNTPTPETDAAQIDMISPAIRSIPRIGGDGGYFVDAEFARRLERERNEFRRELDRIATLAASLSDSPVSLLSHLLEWAEARRRSASEIGKTGMAGIASTLEPGTHHHVSSTRIRH